MYQLQIFFIYIHILPILYLINIVRVIKKTYFINKLYLDLENIKILYLYSYFTLMLKR